MTNSQKNIYTILHSHNFLRLLAKGILKKVNFDPFKLAEVEIYLPNLRSADHLKLEFADLSPNGACILPKIKTIGIEDELEVQLNILESLGEDIIFKKEIDKYDRLFLIVGLIKNFESLELNFQGIGDNQAMMLAYSIVELLDDCTRYKTDNLEGIANIFVEELAIHKQVSLKFLNYIFVEYPKRLEALNLTDAIANRNLITEKIAECYNVSKTDRLVVLAGSTGTLPSTRKLIESILDLPNGHVILPNIDLDLNEDIWQEIGENKSELSHQSSLKNLLEFLEVERRDIRIFESGENIQDYSKIASEIMKPARYANKWTEAKLSEIDFNSIQVAEVETTTKEAMLISIIIKEAIKSDKKCALVTENKKLIEYIKCYLKKFNTSIDNSIGVSYSKSEEGKFILNIAYLISSGFKTTTLIEILKSPFLDFENPEDILKFKKFINNFEKKIARKYDLKTIDSVIRHVEVKKPFNDSEQAFYQKYILSLKLIASDLDVKENTSPSDFVSVLKNILNIFLPKEKTLKINEEASSVIEKISLSTKLGSMKKEDFYDIIFNIFSRIITHPKAFDLSNVSILAPVETRLLHFDRVIICGANLGSFPSQKFSQWMNKPMKRDFGLPPEELEISLVAHDFSALLQMGEVFITRSVYDDSEPTSPSPFLTRVKAFLDAKNISYDLDSEYFDILETLENEGKEKKFFERPVPKPPAKYRRNNISATAVEKIIKNPYWFYAKEILGLKKLPSLEEPSERKDYGQFVHASLEEFLNSHQLEKDKISISNLNKIFAKKFTEYDSAGVAEPLWLLETSEIAPWYVDQERTRVENIKSAFAEARGACQIHGLVLSGIADRIEIDKQNNLTVIDFKTGRTPSEKDVRNLISPQLLLEMIIAQNNGFDEVALKQDNFDSIDSAIYYSISLSGNGPSITEIKILQKDDLLEAVNDELKNLADSLLDEDTPFLAYPDKNNLPEYDDYYHLARYED